MSTDRTTTPTGYERRLQTVTEAVRGHSKLGDKAAGEVAVHVLHALDTIPEKLR
ncbi:DUF6307 family protein [Actinokineospora sp. PR83]|uniref:DUF6307 family protein n=1 Tax=Actinokineospora sp. PR83 TaxID=2884908 RepID=UPI001F2DD03A|nr:DUF6307 family protein [Actinokineospora sp. PR83]MCG8916051.1 DUF6307 family protein [Actinokineospora sp. PR83]